MHKFIDLEALADELAPLIAARLGGQPSPAQPAARPPPRSNGVHTIKFGRCTGTAFADAEDADLRWYGDLIERDLANPAKARFRAENESDLAALRAEQRKRAGRGDR